MYIIIIIIITRIIMGGKSSKFCAKRLHGDVRSCRFTTAAPGRIQLSTIFPPV